MMTIRSNDDAGVQSTGQHGQTVPRAADVLGTGPVAVDFSRAEAWCAQADMGRRAIQAVDDDKRYAVHGGFAIVPVRGILTPNSEMLERWLGWTTYHGLEQTCETLAAAEDVAVVVLEIDSPGGSVLGMQTATEAVARLAAIKPVHALVNPLATSAAYWIASQATDITMTPGSWVGSIGVMAASSTAVQPGTMSGFQYFEMRSSLAQGKNADLATDEGRALMQAQLDEFESNFHAAVAEGRGIPVADLPSRLSADGDRTHGGGTFMPADAITRGLADAEVSRISFYDDLFARFPPVTRRPIGALSAQAKARAATAVLNS